MLQICCKPAQSSIFASTLLYHRYIIFSLRLATVYFMCLVENSFYNKVLMLKYFADIPTKCHPRGSGKFPEVGDYGFHCRIDSCNTCWGCECRAEDCLVTSNKMNNPQTYDWTFFVHQLTGPCTLVGCPDWPRQPCQKNKTGSLFLQYLLYRSSLLKKLILTFDVVHILHCRRFLLHGQALCERSLPSQPHQILLQGWRVPKGSNFSSFVSRRNKHFTVVFLFSVYLQRLPWHVEQLPLLVVV